ncbi:hypothetical protein K490DRAFT_63044 [Saccharata proteae CBS 121410]|uniref:Nuclease PA3 n=1 Tax=Saccharata proteae CBS 121410 TaxID=1314787 RepID=A0A9P4HZ95_9PEZI|nr:hypothetical protein K490DRAFT_63044 [Saccharata proteae CBS 121410]
MTRSLLLAAPLLLRALPSVQAWGSLGHETIAYIATNFVSAATKSWAQDLLDDTTTSYLANVATWADSYRYTSEGSFSAEYHFVDANDDPPSSCSVEFERDCPDSGCIISAIANYTSRVGETSLSTTQRQMALKWIIHFLGDIHQPLHDEALAYGANDIDVTFDDSKTNLHHIWDTNMPEQLVGGYSLTDAKSWAKTLTTAIKSGTYKSSAAGWLDGMDIDDAESSALLWAQGSNAYVCSTVMPDGYSVLETGDLSGDYYDGVIDVIKQQIAMSGYRLAAWLDLIATGETGLAEKLKKRDHTSKTRPYVFPPRGWAKRDNEAERQAHARRHSGHRC